MTIALKTDHLEEPIRSSRLLPPCQQTPNPADASKLAVTYGQRCPLVLIDLPMALISP